MADPHLDPVQSAAQNVERVRPTPVRSTRGAQQSGGSLKAAKQAVSFKEILAARSAQGLSVAPLRFSAHAQERLKQREIALSPQDLEKLDMMVSKAAEKGSRDALILMDNLALVVSIKNRVVVTAVDGPHLKENIFTNIDSAVIM